MDYTAIGRTNDYYTARKRKNALSKILAESYEPGQSVPFVDEAAQYMGAESPEGMVARVDPGQINVKNAIARLAESGDGETALALQQAVEDRAIKQMALKGNLPADVVSTKWLTEQPDEIRKLHFENKRAPNVMNLGGSMVVRDPRGGIQEEYQVTPKPEQMPSFRGKQAEEVEKGKVRGESSSSLEGDLADIDKFSSEIKGLLDSPGFKIIYGKSRYIDPRSYDMGGDAAGSEARRKQLEGASFGIAIKKMVGLGSLSNAEGQKIGIAYTRATDPNQGEEDARKAWEEVVELLDSSKERAKTKAGASYSPRGKQEQKKSIPSGAKRFMDNQTGREVFTTDGKTYFDAVTGKRVE